LWPPYLPDLNIIENLWAILKNKVYEGGKEYSTVDELWESICHHFLMISKETIKGMYQSIGWEKNII
jgi:transposase